MGLIGPDVRVRVIDQLRHLSGERLDHHQRRPRSLPRQLLASLLTDPYPVLHRLVIAPRQRGRAAQRARQVGLGLAMEQK